ncbi:hypothetical protein M885DRAFT_542198 [Pelagophyceae sp. CCMP2097]|nr:hypothetical protein M885DRAFT_542198 [Pelagophyceae sp. CCMP2097]
MRPAAFGTAGGYDRTRFNVGHGWAYYAPEPASLCPFGGYYARCDSPGAPPVAPGAPPAAPACQYGNGAHHARPAAPPQAGAPPGGPLDRAPPAIRRSRDAGGERTWDPPAAHRLPRAGASQGLGDGPTRARRGGPPDRTWFDDGDESASDPGALHRYLATADRRLDWSRAPNARPALDGGDGGAHWEWLGRGVTTYSESSESSSLAAGAAAAATGDEAPAPARPADDAERLVDASLRAEAAAERLERAVALADGRAGLFDGAAQFEAPGPHYGAPAEGPAPARASQEFAS